MYVREIHRHLQNDLFYDIKLKGESKSYIREVEVLDLVPKIEPTIAAAISRGVGVPVPLGSVPEERERICNFLSASF